MLLSRRAQAFAFCFSCSRACVSHASLSHVLTLLLQFWGIWASVHVWSKSQTCVKLLFSSHVLFLTFPHRTICMSSCCSRGMCSRILPPPGLSLLSASPPWPQASPGPLRRWARPPPLALGPGPPLPGPWATQSWGPAPPSLGPGHPLPLPCPRRGRDVHPVWRRLLAVCSGGAGN